MWWQAVVVIVGLLAASLVADALLRGLIWRNRSCCEVVTLRSKPESPNLIVYLPGIIANATMMPEKIVDVWSRYGEVWGLDYSSPRFDPRKVVEEVSRRITHVHHGLGLKKVVLIGSSMGGLLAYDLTQTLKDLDVEVAVVLVDAPTGRKDLQPPLSTSAPLVRALPFGPLWNIMSKPIMKLLFIPPKEDSIEQGVDRDWLDRNIAEAQSFPMSFWRDQIMYILTHGGPAKDSMRVRTMYIRSDEDFDTVRASAEKVWWSSVCIWSGFQALHVPTKHAAYAESPTPYADAFYQILEELCRA